jgi:hypothetical protein
VRNFQTLSQISSNTETGILYIMAEDGSAFSTRLSLRQEGDYLAISTSFGPVEVAMRPRHTEVTRVFTRLRPVQGLQTTRQIGSGQAYLAVGLQPDKSLVLRPTLVSDATGHIAFNLLLPADIRHALFDWLLG